MLRHAERDVRIFSCVVLARSRSTRFTLNSPEEIKAGSYSNAHFSQNPTSRVGREDRGRSLLRWQSEEILSFVNQRRGGTEVGEEGVRERG